MRYYNYIELMHHAETLGYHCLSVNLYLNEASQQKTPQGVPDQVLFNKVHSARLYQHVCGLL